MIYNTRNRSNDTKESQPEKRPALKSDSHLPKKILLFAMIALQK